jgi:hypothetical protein
MRLLIAGPFYSVFTRLLSQAKPFVSPGVAHERHFWYGFLLYSLQPLSVVAPTQNEALIKQRLCEA